MALRLPIGSVRYPQNQDPRHPHHPLTEGSPAWQLYPRRLDHQTNHQAVLATFRLSPKAYGLNQIRYDLLKLKGHGLLQRDGYRCGYRLTPNGVQVALLFLFFHTRLCGPPADSRFHQMDGYLSWCPAIRRATRNDSALS